MTVQFFSDNAVAARYSVCRGTIWRWVRVGKLPAPVKINGSTRWPAAALEEWERKEGIHND